jgi:hypothetical protein
LQRAHVDARFAAGLAEPRARAVRDLDVLGPDGAVFEADHSASPLSLLKTASSFRDSTSSAAV